MKIYMYIRPVFKKGKIDFQLSHFSNWFKIIFKRCPIFFNFFPQHLPAPRKLYFFYNKSINFSWFLTLFFTVGPIWGVRPLKFILPFSRTGLMYTYFFFYGHAWVLELFIQVCNDQPCSSRTRHKTIEAI